MTPYSVEIFIKSSAIIAGAAVATALMRRRASAASRHLAWTFAVVALLALPIAVVVLPSWNIAIRRQMPLLSVVQPPAPVAFESDSSPAVDAAVRSDATPVGAAPGLLSFIAILPIVYTGVVAFLLARLGFEHRHTRRILSRATPVTDVEWTRLLDECAAQFGVRRPVRLLRSREEVMPMTSGVRQPSVVIPSIADLWGADRRRAVILHELAHVVRLDCLTQTLAAVAAAVYWPHPGVWWTARRLRVERELACDDWVLSSGTEPREYAGHLLEIAHSLGHHRAPALAAGMARPRQLEGRMMAMLDPTRNRAVPAAGRRVLALASAVIVVVPLATATLGSVPVTADALAVTAPRSAAADGAAVAAQTRALETTALAGGTWQIRLGGDGRSAHLTISVTPGSSYGATIALDRVEGLAAILTGPGGPARYTLKRDAGTFEFEGIVRAGAGGGTFSFAPSTAFADALVRRGFSRPSPLELGTLAWSDIGFAFLDELNALKYERPTLGQLVNGARHGVSRTYVREMSDLGYRVGTIDALVRLREHGVDAAYLRGMEAQGFKSLPVEALVRARDHGIDPSFIQGLREAGYALNLEQLVNARNHGVDSSYAREMRAAGLAKLSLDDLVNARNHGVDPSYVQELQALGFKGLSLDDLVNARNHGVDPGFIREMAAAGYPHPSMAELIRLRDHGVNAKTVEQLKRRGFDHPSIDRLIELQSRGASADDATVGPRLYATGSLKASLVAVLRGFHQWAGRWLR